MKTISGILEKVNKYWLAAIFFFVITFVIGDSTLQDRISYDREISRLKQEIEHHSRQKIENRQRLDALQSDNESLEKWAREEYQMLKSDEDLYIIIP
jgi:cell division protein FtsB